MFNRLLNPTKANSFFIFGPRGSGKSTFLGLHYRDRQSIYIDLLEDREEQRYSRDPDRLAEDLKARGKINWVVIDEIQKVPKLLDTVHKLIEERHYRFILTGSSARKLKRGAANLLAGRAFLYHLFPLTHVELADSFDLHHALRWGTLPKIHSFSEDGDKASFLLSYAKIYLKEEILQEQLIRNIEGFRDFLEVAAQMNGKALNLSKIARDCGVNDKTVLSYYQILEDTLMGFRLPAFHRSVRKAQQLRSKFFLFDLGAANAISGFLDLVPTPGTSVYGQMFEQFVITETFKLNSYSGKEYRLSHYQTSTGQEIDLILSKGRSVIAVEIKATDRVDTVEVNAFSRIAAAFEGARLYFVSQDPKPSEIRSVRCLHWKDFLREVFGADGWRLD